MPEDDEQKENTIMGGIFGVASKSSCILDLFFGIDYHSHLGTRRGGMAVYDKKRGFDRVIHNIENAPFRTKFDGDIGEMEGNLGIGCISDNEPQPLLVRSHPVSYTHLRAHETKANLVCRLLLEKKRDTS